MTNSLKKISLIASLVIVLAAFLSAQTTPEAFLGFKVGADRKLADYDQIKAYFEKLAQEAPKKIKLFTLGESTMKKPLIMAAITSEENLAKLDAYREITKKLRDPRTLPVEEAKKLAKDGKAIVLITCSLHSTEIAASQMSMELAYNLVAGKTPFDAKKVLNDVIVLLCPTHNPDGNQMVVDWYKKYVGTKFESGSMPWLYHYYAGHDNNRDWYMMNLVETRAVTKVLYHDWLPQIHVDEHQQGSSGARLFIPPYMDPPLPNVQPLVWRMVNLFGTNMAFDLQRNGMSGVVNGRSYTAWYIGACDDTPWLHNVVGILSEAASVRLASPIFIEPTEIPKSYNVKMMDFPDPWPGGWWRLRDLVDYELTMTQSVIKTASLHKEDLLFNFYQMFKNSVEKVDKNQPFAFVIPAKQHDYPTMLKMLDVLQMGGVEIHQAKADFIAGGKFYPAGSFVVKMAQPYKTYAWAMLEKQKYPDMRQYPGGPPQPPYDNAGWTLPLQMGVACDQVDESFEVKLELLAKTPYPQVPANQGGAAYFVLGSQINASYSIAFALLKDAKAEVWRTKTKVAKKGFDIPAGSFVVKNSPEVKKALPALLTKNSLKVIDLDDAADIAKAPLKFHRVGLYQSWRGNMDEGWTRYMFDDMSIPYKTLHNEDIKGTKEKKVELRADYDVIVLADENATTIKSGSRGGAGGPGGGGAGTGGAQPRQPASTTPPEYEGGIGQEGVDALKAFVEKGGTVVLLNQACTLAFNEYDVPARNGLQNVDRTRFFCPTSILKILVDNETPIGYGMPKEAAAMFVNSLALDTSTPGFEWDRKVVASYPEDDILLSGWLLGPDVLARKAVVVDTKYKDGHIILIGIRCQNRAQSHGTYKFLLNGLLYPEKE
ncbi:MAG: M14 family metallopeptidase [Candidatus Aminicenantes bacterium]|nr:M14 family metallopeptidase [Candidatus Aminicenantes bacterium]